MDICKQHQNMVIELTKLTSTVENMDKSFKEIKDRMVNHINEGEKPGGIREIVHDLTKDVADIRKGMWRVAIVGGLIGGLISQLTPEIFGFIMKLLFKI